MRTREELDEFWDELVSIAEVHTGALRIAVATERAYADRQAMARAVRWAAAEREKTFPQVMTFLREIADRIESREVEVP